MRRNLDATADAWAIGEFVDRPSQDSVRERIETATCLLTELSDSDPERRRQLRRQYMRERLTEAFGEAQT